MIQTDRTEGTTTMTTTTTLPTRTPWAEGRDGVPTTFALVTFFLMRGNLLHQVEALRIAYTTQTAAERLADEVLYNLLMANPNTFGTYTLTWPRGI